MTAPRSHRPLLALVLLIYLALALGYGWVNPLFEAPDEHMHYFTADFIAREGRLPTTRDAGLMAQEAAQPPLYYALAALIIRAVPDSAVTGPLWLNPRGDPADPRGESLAQPPLNVNVFIQGPETASPWHGYALAAHLIRMLSALFGLGTLLCIYGAGRAVWPRWPGGALLAVALVAFLPQFAFIHGAVSNDPAITFFSAAAVWQLLRVRSDGLRVTSEGRGRRSIVWRCLALGVTVGLAMLSKTAGLLLLVFGVGVVFAFVWSWGGDGRWQRASVAAAAVAGPALLLGGWWLWRNWTLYGDPTAANQFALLTGGERAYTLAQVWGDMDRVWTSLFARFGWMNVRPPGWVWGVWNGISLVAVVGAVWGVAGGLRRRRGQRVAWARLLFHPAVLLGGWLAVVALAWLQFMLRTPADQGRLFFPALVAPALGAAYGLGRWPRPWAQGAAVLLALATSVYSLAVVIPNAYAPPPLVAALPDDALPLDAAFPEGLELLGARVETTEARPGEWVWLTLYWQARPDITDGAPLVELELFGRDFHRVGQQVNYHGRGNYPATLWPAGALVADRIAVRVDEMAAVPVEARLAVKLDGEGEGVDVGTIKLVPAAWPAPGEPLATFGGAVALTAAELSRATAAPGETVELRLRWQVIAPPGPAALHLFAHVGDPAQPPLGQADGPVAGGVYPPRLWAAGEIFEETVTISLPADMPPGSHPVQVGLYDFDSGARLPLLAGGQPVPGGALEVGRLDVQ